MSKQIAGYYEVWIFNSRMNEINVVIDSQAISKLTNHNTLNSNIKNVVLKALYTTVVDVFLACMTSLLTRIFSKHNDLDDAKKFLVNKLLAERKDSSLEKLIEDVTYSNKRLFKVFDDIGLAIPTTIQLLKDLRNDIVHNNSILRVPFNKLPNPFQNKVISNIIFGNEISMDEVLLKKSMKAFTDYISELENELNKEWKVEWEMYKYS